MTTKSDEAAAQLATAQERVDTLSVQIAETKAAIQTLDADFADASYRSVSEPDHERWGSRASELQLKRDIKLSGLEGLERAHTLSQAAVREAAECHRGSLNREAAKVVQGLVVEQREAADALEMVVAQLANAIQTATAVRPRLMVAIREAGPALNVNLMAALPVSALDWAEWAVASLVSHGFRPNEISELNPRRVPIRLPGSLGDFRIGERLRELQVAARLPVPTGEAEDAA